MVKVGGEEGGKKKKKRREKERGEGETKIQTTTFSILPLQV